MKKLLVLGLSLALGSASAHDHGKIEHGKGETKLKDCVIQQPLPGKNMTGGFLKMFRKGASVKIEKGEIPTISDQIEFHSMEMKGDVMEMIPLTDPIVNEGVRLFRKGGDHIMLMNIADDKLPKAGEKHQITIHFADGTSASCDAIVKTAEAIIEEDKKRAEKHGKKKEGEHKHDHHGHDHKHGEHKHDHKHDGHQHEAKPEKK